jgi:hypothetical protein
VAGVVGGLLGADRLSVECQFGAPVVGPAEVIARVGLVGAVAGLAYVGAISVALHVGSRWSVSRWIVGLTTGSVALVVWLAAVVVVTPLAMCPRP